MKKKHRAIVEQLKEIMVEGRTGNGIILKKVTKNVWRINWKGRKQFEWTKSKLRSKKKRVENCN